MIVHQSRQNYHDLEKLLLDLLQRNWVLFTLKLKTVTNNWHQSVFKKEVERV